MKNKKSSHNLLSNTVISLYLSGQMDGVKAGNFNNSSPELLKFTPSVRGIVRGIETNPTHGNPYSTVDLRKCEGCEGFMVQNFL